MKIAIASDWFAPRRGGIEGHLSELAERLGARGHDVDVLTSTPGARDGESFRVRELDIAKVPGIDVALFPDLLPAIRRELTRGYDVMHAHVSVVSPVGYAAALVARSAGIPAVLTFHSVLRQKKFLLAAANTILDLKSSGIVWSGVSRLVASQLRYAFGDGDIGVLPNATDLRFWNGASRRDGDQRDQVTLVSTMRLQRKKRPLALLRAFAFAAARMKTSVRLLIVGEGPERAAMEREIVDLRLGEGRGRAEAELLGWIGRDALRTLYAEADGFVLASRRESFGIAALEARAAGLPVITMADSGSSEFLYHDTDSMLCRSDADLVRAIARFSSEVDLRRRLAAAPALLDRYDWTSVLSEHEACYARAITRARSAEAAARSG